MHEIQPNLLWIGHAIDVRAPHGLFDAGIKAVIDVAYEERPAQIPRQLIYCRFPLNDGGGNDPNTLLQVLRITTALLQSKTKTIIACSAGMSRSPTIAAFSLAYHLSENPDEVIARIADIKSLELKADLLADTMHAYNRLRSSPDAKNDA